MTYEIIIGLLLGIGLSACCGFKVFIPLLIGSVATKMGWVPVSENFGWLGSWTSIICFGVAATIEAIAYYVPFLDNLLDTIAAPAAVLAGTIMSASTMITLDPSWQWILGLIVGGGTAGVMHAGTSLLRLGSSKFTLGTGNAAVNTGEIGVSIIGSFLSIALPFIVGGFALVTVFVILFLLARKAFKSTSA